jgi:ketosteroid isomerase-like protein
MAIQRATEVEALRAMDLEGVMSLYAPDIVSFDIVPPLRHVGEKAKEKNWAHAFAIYQRPLGYEIRDLTLTLGDDVAFEHSLNRVSGTSKNGISGFVGRRAFGRSTATGSSRTTRFQCLSIRRAAERY